MQTSFILKENEALLPAPYNLFGHPAWLKVGGKDTEGGLSMFLGTYVKQQGPPLHLHDVDETFYILEGEFIFQTGDIRLIAASGDTVFIPRNMPHTFLTSSETGKMLFMVSPAGQIESFFEKLSSYLDIPPVEEVDTFHETYKVKILGPPLT